MFIGSGLDGGLDFFTPLFAFPAAETYSLNSKVKGWQRQVIKAGVLEKETFFAFSLPQLCCRAFSIPELFYRIGLRASATVYKIED